MANVLIESQTMTDIANAIREKSGTDVKMKPAEMPQAIASISTDSSLIKLLEETDTLESKFRNTNIEEIPKFRINPKCVSAYKCFDGCKKLKYFDNNFDTSHLTDSTFSMFADCVELISVKGLNIKNTGSAHWLFFNCHKLQSVDILDLSSIVNNNGVSRLLEGCYALRDITFVNQSIKWSLSIANSPLLTDESIQSIIDGLADLTGQTAQTITFHPDVKNKLTEEQIASATSKNWNIA